MLSFFWLDEWEQKGESNVVDPWTFIAGKTMIHMICDSSEYVYVREDQVVITAGICVCVSGAVVLLLDNSKMLASRTHVKF